MGFDILREFLRLLAQEIEKARVQVIETIVSYDTYTVNLTNPRDKEEQPWGETTLLCKPLTGN